MSSWGQLPGPGDDAAPQGDSYGDGEDAPWRDRDYESAPPQPDAAHDYFPAPRDDPAPGAQRPARGALGTSRSQDTGPGEVTGPPWELPGWDDSQPGRRARPSGGLSGGHPSGPLPRLPSPGPLPRVSPDSWPGATSGPLPPLPPGAGGWPDPADRDYPGRGFDSERAPGSGYPAEPYPGENGYPGDGRDAYSSRHEDAPYLRTGMTDPGYGGGHHADPGYPRADSRYPGYGDPPGPPAGSGGYARDDYGSEHGYPGEDFGGGYAHEPGYEPGPGYPPGDGYPGGESYHAGDGYGRNGGYPGHSGYAGGQEAGYPRRDHDGDAGYGEHGDWYAGVDDDQARADGEPDGEAGDDYSDGFLAGFSRDADPRRARAAAPDYGRAPRGGGSTTRSRGGGNGKGRGGGKGKGHKSPMRRAAPWIALSVVVVTLAVLGGVGYYFYRAYLHPPDYSGPGTGEVTVHITSGESAGQVGQQLLQQGVVASTRAFSNAAKASGRGSALEVGYYQLHKHMNAALAFALLLKPSSRVQLTLTVPPGLRLYEIIALLGKETGNLKGYQQAIKDVAALGLPPYAKGNPEGYLFPDTYSVLPGTPPTQVLREMVARFDQQAASLDLPSVAAHDQVSEGDIIKTASLVEGEGSRPSDLAKIARVIYNRLNAKMPLQLDSTVLYARHSRAHSDTVAQTRDTKSPYNTYLHTGLPPGPIDSPGLAAIKAALHPTRGNWLYFVTVNPHTGLTKFTASYATFQVYEAELNAYLAKHN